jgi:hypothetical protein
MVDFGSAWRGALDEIKKDVTGRTLWQALDSVVPILLDGDIAVLGVPHEESSVIGHLRMTQTRRVIEMKLSARLGKTVRAEIIIGETPADWQGVKDRVEQVTQLQQREYEKAHSVRERERQWEAAYEQLSRMFNAVPNKSLPQSRARYVIVGVDAIAEAIGEQGELDEVGDRSVARLIERVAQYAEVPPTQVALLLLRKLGEIRE